MIFLFDINKYSEIICRAININGYAPEHNFNYFLTYESNDVKTCYVDFGNNKGIMCIQYDNSDWQIISEPIAPKNEQSNMLFELINELIEKYSLKKLLLEIDPIVRKELIKKTKNSKIIIGKVLEHYRTPIIDLKEWDSELNGSDMSKLRKAKNRFFRNYKIEIITNVNSIPFEDYKNLVLEWKKYRKAKDRAVYEDYITFFKENFKGADFSIAIKINDKLCGVASSWIVPNNKKTVYYGINLQNYSISELGDFLTINFLDELKKSGYEFLNFGASDKKLLTYKNKFKPVKYYSTMCFYVRIKKE